MVHAKNYETVSKFVTVMPKNNVASFFSGHGVQPLHTGSGPVTTWVPMGG